MKKQLLFKAPIRGVSGYATYSRELLKAFTKKYDGEYKLQAWSYPWQEYDIPLGDMEEEALVKTWVSERVNKKDAILLNWTLPHEFLPDCKYNIGYTLFETDRIPDKWRVNCDRMHEMWLPSTFNQKTFRDGGVAVPIHVIPGGVEDFYFTDILPMDIPEITTQYNFFTGGQWIPGENDRKNFGKIIYAFCDQFRDNRDVGLIAKVYTHNNNTIDYYGTSSRIDEIKQKMGVGEFPKIYLVHGSLTKEQILGLIKRADCAVMPSPEGWGMWHIQCAAAGLPVIAYDWSSYTDFLRADLTPYVKAPKMVPVSMEMQHLEPYREYQCWPDLEIPALKKVMFDVYKNQKEWQKKAIIQKQYLYDNWRWEHAADKMFNRLEVISEQSKTNTIYPLNKYEENIEDDYGAIIPTYLGITLHNNKKAFYKFMSRLEEVQKEVAGRNFPNTVYVIDNSSNLENSFTPSEINELHKKYGWLSFKVCDKIESFSECYNQIWEAIDVVTGKNPYTMLFMDVNMYITNPDFIRHMSNIMTSNDSVGCVGCRIMTMEGKIYSAGTYITTHSLTGINLGNGEPLTEYFEHINPVQGVSGLCTMYWGELWGEIGGFDPEYFSAYKNTAIQLAVQNVGYTVLMDGGTEIAYDEESSRITAEFDIQQVVKDDKTIFERKWKTHPLLTNWKPR